MKKILTVFSMFVFWIGTSVRAQTAGYTYTGVFDSFWRYGAALGGYNSGGDFHSGGQGLKVVPDHLSRNNDFPYVKRPYPKENLFADHLSLVRILGGFGGGDSNPVVRDQDLVYTNAAGEYEYRMDMLENRLRPYLDNGYTNYTVVFDNIPWDFTDAPRDGSFGQCGIPRDFNAWSEFITVFCSNFVRIAGAENAGHLRFRTGTEYHNLERFYGTESEFMDYYNSCWHGVSNILPHAQFGPYNFFNPSVSQMDAHSGNHNVNTLLIPQEKDPAAPFDWVSTSTYYEPGNSPAEKVAPQIDVWNEFTNRYPGLPPFSREVHEFGILTEGHDEPGALGGAMTAQMIMRLKAGGLDRLWHWWMLDEFRDQNSVMQGLLISDAWLYSVFEYAKGGDSWVLYPVNSSAIGTEHIGICVEKESETFIMLSAYNKKASKNTAEEIAFRIPKSGREINISKLRFITLNSNTALHDQIYRDLLAGNLLSSYFQANPGMRGRVRQMVKNTDGAREGEIYVGENLERYQRFWQDSLLLKPVSERGNITIADDGDSYLVTARLDVPEVLLLNAPVDISPAVEWSDSSMSGNWNENGKWNSSRVPDGTDAVLWRYADSYPEISVTAPVEIIQFRAECSVPGSCNNRAGGLKILNAGLNSGSLTVNGGDGVINMHVSDWNGARLYVANADSNAAASVVQADYIDVDSLTLGSVPDSNSYYTHEGGYLGMQQDLKLGDAGSVTPFEAVFRQTGGQIYVDHKDYPLLIGNVNQRGRFILDNGIFSSGISFGNTDSLFEFSAGRFRSGNRDVDWGGDSVTGMIQFAEEGTREITVHADKTLTVKPTARFEDRPYCAGSFLKNGEGTMCFADGAAVNLSGYIRIEAGTVEFQTKNLNPQLSLILDEAGTVNLNFTGTASVQRISFDGGKTWQSSGRFDSNSSQFSGTGVLELRDFYYHWKDPAMSGSWDIATNWLEGSVPPDNMGVVWRYADGRPVLQITNAVRIADLVVEKITGAADNTSGLYIDNWDHTDGSLVVKNGYGNINMGTAHLRVYNNDPARAAEILKFNRFTGRGFDISTYGGTSFYTHAAGEIETTTSIGLNMANSPANTVEFRQTGGSVFCNNTDWSLQLGNKNGTGKYILDGGTCSFTIYFKGNTSCLEFNNGTWQSRDKNYTWKAPLIQAQVRFAGSGAHIIDVSAGQNLTVTPEVMLIDKLGEKGTFTKTGAGEMIVQSGLELSGEVEVDEGTLTLSTGMINSNLVVAIGSDALFNLNFSGTGTVYAASFDGGETWAMDGIWGGPGSGAENIISQLNGTGVLEIRSSSPSLPTSVSDIGISFDHGNAVIRWNGEAGGTYAVQRTEDLVNGIWSNVAESLTGTGIIFATNNASAPRAFYRAILQ